MARDLITPVDLKKNSSVAEGTYVTAVAANGLYIDNVTTEQILLHVKNANATTDVKLTLKAGTFTNGDAYGDLDITVPKASVAFIGPLESSRFKQAGGDINIDVTSVASVTVLAYKIPRGVAC